LCDLQQASANIPGCKIDTPKRIKPPAGDPGKIKGHRTAASHSAKAAQLARKPGIKMI
jgi:hypothetical protein